MFFNDGCVTEFGIHSIFLVHWDISKCQYLVVEVKKKPRTCLRSVDMLSDRNFRVFRAQHHTDPESVEAVE